MHWTCTKTSASFLLTTDQWGQQQQQLDCTIARLWNYTLSCIRTNYHTFTELPLSHSSKCAHRLNKSDFHLWKLLLCHLILSPFVRLPLSMYMCKLDEKKRRQPWWWWLVSIELLCSLEADLPESRPSNRLPSWDSLILICRKVCGQLLIASLFFTVAG